MKGRKGSKRVPLYKPCERCGKHSYLTMGGFYLCTDRACGHRDFLNLGRTKDYQSCLGDEIEPMKTEDLMKLVEIEEDENEF